MMPSPRLNPLAPKQSTTSMVIQALQEYIVDNDLKEGSRFFSEAEVCQSLGVSRIVVRESMQHFKSLGIVDAKPHRGTYIKSLMPQSPYANFIPFFRQDNQTIRAIVQMRAMVELGLCLEIKELITDEHLDELRRINQALLASTVEERVSLDMAFHTYLLGIPQNPLLSGLQELIIDFFQKSHEAHVHVHYSQVENKKVFDEHQAIIEALARRDEGMILAAVQAHINQYKKNFL